MILYTKDRCQACEEVKMIIDQKVMKIKEKLETQNAPMTFPVLELENKELINPSGKIKEFLQFMKDGIFPKGVLGGD